MSEYELYHHGVKGMKWGVRRTKAQLGHKVKKFVKKTKKSINNAVEKRKAKEAEKKKASKSIHELSEAELKERINRLTLEKDYLDLKAKVSELSPKRVSIGESFAKTFVDKMVGPAAEDVGKQLVKSGMVGALNSALKLPDDLKLYTNNKKK